MPLAEAQVLAPRGWFAVHDPVADREALRRLAWTCQRFTPIAGLEETSAPESLFLDVTGCVPHFGTLRKLCDQIVESFSRIGYRVKIGAAPTFGAAWAVAQVDQKQETITILESNDLHETLSRLPVWTLRLPEKVLSLLEECGLRKIDQLLPLPRSSLPSRFGPQLLLRLDQALGNVEELLTPERPPEPIQVTQRFEFPLHDAEAIRHILWRLLDDVMTLLNRRQQVTQQMLITWEAGRQESGELKIRLLSPTASPERFQELLWLQLERLRMAEGMTSIQAEVIPCVPEAVRRRGLFDDDDHREREFLHLVERLSSRLGEEAVVRYRCLPESQPERAVTPEPWLKTTTREIKQEESCSVIKPSRRRPLRLFADPVPIRVITTPATGQPNRLRWKSKSHAVSLCKGPERIVTGWWRGPMVRRDYYRIETTTGARFWLFHHLDRGTWYLQGLFE